MITMEHQSGDMTSTVDVLAGSEEIAQHLEYCRIHGADYGSDHRPLTLSYLGGFPPRATQRRKRLCKDANWAEDQNVNRWTVRRRPLHEEENKHHGIRASCRHFRQRHQRYARGTRTSGKAVTVRKTVVVERALNPMNRLYGKAESNHDTPPERRRYCASERDR
jgi:hypothetical protein